MTRRPSARIVALVFVVLAALGGGAYLLRDKLFKSGGGPGIPLILISVDTCRADAVSGFGAPPEQTPTLLKIGDEGMRFERAISASHVTAPSHATILTGYSPYVHATAMSYKKASAIPRTMPTLGEILRQSKYYSAAYTDAGQMVQEGGFQQGFDIFLSDPAGMHEKLPKIEQFLDEVQGSPFFLFVHTYRAHQPYRVPTRLLPNLIKNYDGVFLEGARLAANTSIRESMTNGGKLEKLSTALSAKKAKNDEDRAFFRKLYNAGVTGADDEVSELIDILKKRNIYDGAMIVITSDHGEAFFEHGEDSHKDIYEECIHVPLIIKFPGGAHAGARISQTFPAVNLTPTILDFLQIKHGYAFEGRSVARECLEGKLPEQLSFMHWLMGGDDRMPLGFGVRSSSGKWIEKEMRGESKPDVKKEEYYNLADDPAEKKNLAGAGGEEEKRLRGELQKMKELWSRWRQKYHQKGIQLNELSDKDVEHLRMIGYINK